MPRVDEVPLATAAHLAPGYAYVPDTGFDPSKTAINPNQARSQRAARAAVQQPLGAGSIAGAAELTARQQAAIQRHIAELDKDNFKDVPVPQATRSIEKLKGKTTAVKKILLSQKNFAYHLSDEEAWLSQQPSQPAVPTSIRTPSSTPAPSRPSKVPKSRRKPQTQDVGMPPPPVPDSARSEEKMETESQHPLLTLQDPLVMPSSEELEALFESPMLSYKAAQVGPPGPNAPPARKFCEICGYWGTVKCMKCGARVCGLECRVKHDESRCQRFFG